MEPGVFISRCFFFTLGDFDVREICNKANCIFTARITVHYLHTDRARTSTSYTWCICDRDGSKPRYTVFKTQICSFKTQICSFQNAYLQFTKRRRSVQNIPVSPPSHDRLNSATFPRAVIVFVALSSKRLYSIPRPYMRSSFTGCLNTCVFHTKWCPFLWSFLAWFQNTSTRFKTQI